MTDSTRKTRSELREIARQFREVEANVNRVSLLRRPEDVPGYAELAARSGPVPPYDESWELRGDFAYAGEYGHGKAFIWRGKGNATITRPIVLVEGFDPFNEIDYVYLYNRMNAEGLVTDALAAGFDLVILDFTRGADYLQRNAFVIVALLQKLRTLAPAHQTVLVGASMGGLLARYALAYMASQGLQHNTSHFLSFDAPQRGANIPLGLQHFLSYFSRSSAAEELRKQIERSLDSPASRQMLTYHYLWGGGENDRAQPDPLRITLLAELEKYGSYPAGVKKAAVANGSGHGTTLYEPRVILLDWDRVGAWGWCFALPTFNPSGWDEIFKGWYCGDAIWSKHIKGARPFDGCPGGRRDTVKFVAEQLITAAGGRIKQKQDEHCFIPTVSALDGGDDRDPDNPLISVQKAEAEGHFKSAFDSYIYCEKNENHIFINAEINAFMKKFIGM